MPKPTTEITLDTETIPFYYVRIAPALFQSVEAHRLAMGYNKKKTVEVMAELFLHIKPSAPVSPRPRKAKKKAAKKTHSKD